MKFETETRPFCFCGRLATKQVGSVWFCDSHKEKKVVIKRNKELHGKSKSPNRHYDYQ